MVQVLKISPPLMLCGVFLLVFSPAPAQGASCVQLVKTRCISCHFETRICAKLKRNKGKRSWKRTIKSMIRHGAQLDDRQRAALVQCLAAGDPSLDSLCTK